MRAMLTIRNISIPAILRTAQVDKAYNIRATINGQESTFGFFSNYDDAYKTCVNIKIALQMTGIEEIVLTEEG